MLRILKYSGIDLNKFFSTIKNIPRYLFELSDFKRKNTAANYPIKNITKKPILIDYNQNAGHVGFYFVQDLWASKIVYELAVKEHYDIGSRIDGFLGQILVFSKVVMIDIRPLPFQIKNLSFIQSDATTLSQIPDDSIESLSSLNAVEHFGLGRYNDPIDPDAWLNFINSSKRVLKKNGSILFAVPIGDERIEFNAHRIFNPRTILEKYKPLALEEFSVINNKNEIISNANPDDYTSNDTYAIGLFHFINR